MPELIRKDTEYAMRALVYLALNGKEKFVTAKALALHRNLPEDFAYKIMRKLTRSGITTCQMGQHGGFKLARSPDEITLLQVLSAIQGPVLIKKCCLDSDTCPEKSSCEFLPQLKDLQSSLVTSLESITLAGILKQESSRKS